MNTLEKAPQTQPIALGEQPEVTVGIISYNGRKIIELCIESLLRQTYKNFSIQLINNSSTDGTPEWVAEHYPDINILNLENNGPNPARNLAITSSSSNLVLLVDDDAILSDTCLEELVNAAKQYPDAAIWCPRIVYNDRRDTIQFEGAKMHYLTETILVSGDTPLKDGLPGITQMQMIAGVTLLVSQKKAIDIGLMDEYYFFGRTDGEFTYRLTQAGEQIYTVPDAICYHRVKKRGLSKVFYQIRNRWLMMLTMFSLKTIILAAPALLVYELSLIGFLTLKGSLFAYLRAIWDIISHFPTVLQRRKAIQAVRQVPDKELIQYDTINIRGDLVENKALVFLKASLDAFFGFYWKLICRFI